MIIDSQRKFTPRRVTKKSGEAVTIYTDHYAIEVKLEGLPLTKVKPEKETRWNLQKPGGWDMYQKLTKEAADKVERVAKDETLNANEAMKKVVTIEESSLHHLAKLNQQLTRKKLPRVDLVTRSC